MKLNTPSIPPVLMLVVFIPVVGSATELEDEILWARKEAARIEAVQESEEILRQQLTDMKDDIQKLQRIVPPEPEVDRYLTLIRHIAEDGGITVHSSPFELVPAGIHLECSFSVVAQGPPAAMQLFVDRAQRTARVAIWQPTIHEGESVTFDVTLLVMPEPEVNVRTCFVPKRSETDTEAMTRELDDLCNVINAATDERILLEELTTNREFSQILLILAEEWKAKQKDCVPGSPP